MFSPLLPVPFLSKIIEYMQHVLLKVGEHKCNSIQYNFVTCILQAKIVDIQLGEMNWEYLKIIFYK